MKKCKFCSEEIQDDAIKCKHCGEMLNISFAEEDEESNFSIIRIVGLLIFAAGIAFSAYFYLYFDTSVEVPAREVFGQTFESYRVNNIGLMQTRQNSMIVGFVVAGLGLLISRAKNK